MTQQQYLGPDDPGAFKGLAVMAPPSGDGRVACPRCHGHGGWHLRLDAYGDGQHFTCTCGTCFGWGWVRAPACDHDWGLAVVLNQSLREVTCSKCGTVRQIDSSG